jgi:anti-anti-sigma regulatory factor
MKAQPFAAEIHPIEPGMLELRLRGILDEHAIGALENAFLKLRDHRVRIDFSGVVRTSSFGLGVLMRLLNVISRDNPVEFARLSEVMVDHFQMLDFSRYGRIVSFDSRYYCARCGREDWRLVQVDELGRNGEEYVAPTHPCSCGSRMEIDESLDFLAEHVAVS